MRNGNRSSTSSRRRSSRAGQRDVPVPAEEARPKRSRQVLLLLLIALLPLAAFWPVLGNEFITYDDPEYVTLNSSVREGLTWAGVRWAFTTGHAANWHPLTWLSHMADVSLFGLNASGHHATNLLLHLANTLLLFMVFRRLTADSWRSALVAALFAVHPAHVESVAWVAEKKDLLSTAFWLATMWAYGSWVRKRSAGRYLAVLVFLAAGLMSKPMLVSLPLVLLLLDYWPLGRFRHEEGPRTLQRLLPGSSRSLILEKAPLLLMAAASSVVTFLAQRGGGAVQSLEAVPFWARVGNAPVACVRYLKMLVWPADLAVFYPHPGTSLSAGKVFGAALLLLALSAAVVALRRKAPFLLVGWFWFLVTLFPVIGLAQVGFQAMADRYTYVPFIGLFVAIAWGAPALAARWRYGDIALRTGAVAVLLALMLATAAQVRLWKDSETLFLHALRTTKDNFVAHFNLGNYYNETGRPADAVPHLLQAVRIRPKDSGSYVNLGHSLFLQGRLAEAAQQFSRAVRLRSDDASVAWNNLARIRFLQGEISEAARLYRVAVAAKPEWAELRRRLAIALLMEGRTAAAFDQLRRAAALDPSDEECRMLLEGVVEVGRRPDGPAAGRLRKFLAAAHRDAGTALERRGRRAETEAYLRRAIELFPADAMAHTNLGVLLTQEGRLDEAAAEFRLALAIDPESALAHNNLGYVLFRTGRRKAAIEQYVEALRLQPGFPLARTNLEQALRRDESKAGTSRKPRP